MPAGPTQRTASAHPHLIHRIVDWLIDMPERRSAIFSWLPPLFARIVVGWVFMWSGWTKLHNLYPSDDFPGMIARFREWGIPFPEIMTPFVSGVEFLGGLLLLLGLFTRLAATPLVIVMVVAVISAKWDQVDSLETLLGFEELAYMALFGWLAVKGPGPVSVDHLLQRRFGR
ncbi:DoxX family protein [Hyphomicrobium sp.]|uniref:DoxX family protein n=1 Tax=Hyphomicrobium sp. TaxID=82 RepID=UPI0025B94E6B|nr:DoxX family protein [Hyphomicrobium sp.]